MSLNVVDSVEILPVLLLLDNLRAEQVQRCPIIPLDLPIPKSEPK